MTHLKARTWIELNAEAFNSNAALLKQAIGNQQFAVVLKSNAYGHGMIPIAQLAQQNPHIDWICVAGLSEAVCLRNQGITKPLLVLSYLDEAFSYASIHDIHCAIYDYEIAVGLSQAAMAVGKKISVHIKVDTGMGRLGIMPSEALNFAKQISQLPGINLYGVFTHLSEALSEEYSNKQLALFDSIIDELRDYGFSIAATHALSSSGLHISPKKNYSMVRIGAALFGLIKSQEHKAVLLSKHPCLDLKQIMAWKAHIVQIKTISSGSYVGYNRTFCTTQPTRIAIVPIGYYEGYSRQLSNNSLVYIEGQPAQVIGIVSMNLIAIDINHIEDATLSSEVILVGDLPGIASHECASRAKMITNEFSTCIKPDIPRIITHSQAAAYINESPVTSPEIIL